MKVDADLRTAIKAVAASNAKARCDHSGRRDANAKALAKFLKGPHGAAIRKLQAAYTRAMQAGQAVEKRRRGLADNLEAYGIQISGGYNGNPVTLRIGDIDAFQAKGGELEQKFFGNWVADQAIAELVASPESDKKAILKKYGIIWE